MANIKYDPVTKILNIRISNKKSVDSDIKDNVVLDYDSQGELVNVDIMEIPLEEILKTPRAKSIVKKQEFRSKMINDKKNKYNS